MAYTTTQLITRAYYLSGVVSRDFQTVSGSQLEDGLQMLNALLDVKTAQQRFIPYFSVYNFNSVIGQEAYSINNLISVETLTFAIEPVRYSMQQQNRNTYFGSPRANNIQTLPSDYHVERQLGGSKIYMFPLPAAVYNMVLTGKFSLSDVSAIQDLSLTIDMFYLEYLRYALAEYICQEYNRVFQPQNEKKLLEFEDMITWISPIDLTMKKMSSMQRQAALNYGDVNFRQVWRP